MSLENDTVSAKGFWTYENQTKGALAGAQGKVLASLGVAPGCGWHIPGKRYQDGTPAPVFHDGLLLRFTDGTGIYIHDDGYPSKSMDCDDDLGAFVGAAFLGAEVRGVDPDGYPDADSEYDGCEVHEVAFLIVSTSLGEFTVATHNYHNGYYGGFMMEAGWLAPEVMVA